MVNILIFSDYTKISDKMGYANVNGEDPDQTAPEGAV